MESYSAQDIASAWGAIRKQYPSPEYNIRAAVFNAGYGVWKPFLDITPEEVQTSLQTNIASAFAFSREAILSFKENNIEEANGKRGILIFTGATASLRGNVVTSAFAAGKHALRALSQSLAKEFGKQNIHVAHVGLKTTFHFLMSSDDHHSLSSTEESWWIDHARKKALNGKLTKTSD